MTTLMSFHWRDAAGSACPSTRKVRSPVTSPPIDPVWKRLIGSDSVETPMLTGISLPYLVSSPGRRPLRLLVVRLKVPLKRSLVIVKLKTPSLLRVERKESET